MVLITLYAISEILNDAPCVFGDFRVNQLRLGYELRECLLEVLRSTPV